MNKQIYGRFCQKHDIEANWLQATNFAPLAGELIIYDADENYDYPRFKVGIWDGESEKTDDMLVSNLPFVTSEQLLELGLSDYSIQQTDTGSLAGVRGFYWKELSPYHTSPASHRFVLENKPADQYNLFGPFDATEENLAYAESCFQPGDIITVHAGSKFDLAFRVNVVAEETDESGKGMNRIVLSVAAQSDEIPLNLVNEYETTSDVTHFTNNAIFCPTKPSLGPIDFGKYAFAFGENSQATNYNATAFGRKNEAYGQYATAFGRENKVGYAGFAAGRNNTVSGESAAALNQGNTASGNWSFAGGYKSQATDSSAIAYGQMAKATGLYSTAFGEQTEAKGAGAITAGRNTKAEGEASQAFGRNTIAKSAFQFVTGKYNEEDAAETYAHIIGGGHADNNRVNIHTVDWQGNAWYKGSVNANEILVQGFTVALKKDLVGRRLNNGGELFNSAAEAGTNAHAEGLNTKATGSYGHAEGYNTKVTATAGHAEGHTTEAGYVCHAEGQNTVATGSHAHAEGLYTLASGNRAHAEGEKTEASGSRSHAGGVGTKATALAQTAIGKFNAVDNNALFIVGNGSGSIDANGNIIDYAPSNAFVVKEDGTGYLNDKKIVTEAKLESDYYNKSTIDTKLRGNLTPNSIQVKREDYDFETEYTASIGAINNTSENVGITLKAHYAGPTILRPDGSFTEINDTITQITPSSASFGGSVAAKSISVNGSAEFKNEDGDTSIKGAQVLISNGTTTTSITPNYICVGGGISGSGQVEVASIFASSEIRIATSDEGKYTVITNDGEYFGGDMTVNGSVTATSINIGGVTLTPAQLQKILEFIEGINIGGNV